MKTNDVTNRFHGNLLGMAIEMGRPGTGARFTDVEKVTMGIAGLGIHFEPRNPVTCLMEDVHTGKLQEDILNEKVLSAIIGFNITREKVVPLLEKLKEIKDTIDTVFSLNLIYRLDNEAPVTIPETLQEIGFTPSINGKTNVGLGRPLATQELR
jgi:hypothetical protein